MKKKSSSKYMKVINQIENIRKINNKNWMNILRVAFAYAPKQTARIMASIYRDDSKISNLVKKLIK